MSPQLIPLNRPEQMQAAGIPFETEHQARWAMRQSDQNGLTGAFVRIGRRVFVDPKVFHELARKQSSNARPLASE